MRELEHRQREIMQQMSVLAKEFKETFRSPRPAHLAMHHHGGYSHLRWRMTVGRGQRYFELYTSERGQCLLATLPATARPLYLRFEHVRLELNLASSLCQHELRRLRDYLAKLEATHVYENLM